MGILTGAERTSLSGADMKLTKLPLALQDVRKTVSMLTTHTYVHQAAVRAYLQYRAEVYDSVHQRSVKSKEDETRRYDRGIRAVIFKVNDFCLWYSEKANKLEVIGAARKHGVSNELRQLSGRRIRGTFHGDHLKLFTPRTGYLSTSDDGFLPTQQTIRKSRTRKKG